MSSKIMAPPSPPPTFKKCDICGHTVQVPGPPWDSCKETKPPPSPTESAKLGGEPEHRKDGLKVGCILVPRDQGIAAKTQTGSPPPFNEVRLKVQEDLEKLSKKKSNR